MNIDLLSSEIQFDPNNVSARLVLYGEDASHGLVGIQDATTSLLGFQQLFQSVAGYYEPGIKDKDFNLPVTLSKGSLVTELSACWWAAPVFMSSWVGKHLFQETLDDAGKKIAELFPWNKRKEFERKMQVIPVLIYRIIIIGKFLGGIGQTALSNVRLQPTANGNWQLENEHGDFLEITDEELRIFKACDHKICSQLVAPIRQNLQVEYSFFNSEVPEGQTVNLTEQDKEYFYFPEDDEDDETNIVLPELEDGRYYELEGKINRLTERTCSIGFFYHGHTITSIPADKQLAPYKSCFLSKNSDQVFGKVRISGIIERKNSSYGFMRNRPVMHFDKLELLEESNQDRLF